jgi:hypothetical protein
VEDLGVGSVHIVSLKAICTEASRQSRIARIVAAGLAPPSSQPCQAWHGYTVTITLYDEVRVSADGHASAPPRLGTGNPKPSPGPPPLRHR